MVHMTRRRTVAVLRATKSSFERAPSRFRQRKPYCEPLLWSYIVGKEKLLLPVVARGSTYQAYEKSNKDVNQRQASEYGVSPLCLSRMLCTPVTTALEAVQRVEPPVLTWKTRSNKHARCGTAPTVSRSPTQRHREKALCGTAGEPGSWMRTGLGLRSRRISSGPGGASVRYAGTTLELARQTMSRASAPSSEKRRTSRASIDALPPRHKNIWSMTLLRPVTHYEGAQATSCNG
eukprot:scaffold137958_cov34-Tisochrysis_lutea.AAC.4